MSTFEDGGNLLKQDPVGLFNFSVPLYANEGSRQGMNSMLTLVKLYGLLVSVFFEKTLSLY